MKINTVELLINIVHKMNLKDAFNTIITEEELCFLFCDRIKEPSQQLTDCLIKNSLFKLAILFLDKNKNLKINFQSLFFSNLNLDILRFGLKNNRFNFKLNLLWELTDKIDKSNRGLGKEIIKFLLLNKIEETKNLKNIKLIKKIKAL